MNIGRYLYQSVCKMYTANRSNTIRVHRSALAFVWIERETKVIYITNTNIHFVMWAPYLRPGVIFNLATSLPWFLTFPQPLFRTFASILFFFPPFQMFNMVFTFVNFIWNSIQTSKLPLTKEKQINACY